MKIPRFLKDLFSKNFEPTPEIVAQYYDEWNERYKNSFGDIFQSYATKNPDDLIAYIVKSAGIEPGMKILDAGCGICGPAIRIAQRVPEVSISAITVSDSQVKEAEKNISKANLDKQISVAKVDYHEMANDFEGNSFDTILFLESLVHSANPALVIEQSKSLLKSGGSIYIKDLFRFYDDKIQDQIDYAVKNIERSIKLKVSDVNDVIKMLESYGFEIAFCKPLEIVPDFNNGNSFMRTNNFRIFKKHKGPYTGTELQYLAYYEIKAVKK